MPEEHHKIFDYPQSDPAKTDKENEEMHQSYLASIRKWLKGKHISAKVVEENGVVTFLYTEKKEATAK
jgi:hypothetical protein